MSSFEAAAVAIRARFHAEFTAHPVAYGNRAFEAPSAGSDGTQEPWVRFSIAEGEAFHAAFGSGNIWRHPGVVTVQIFVGANTGERSARAIADQIAAIFRGRRVGGVSFKRQPPYLQRVGPDGPWFQMNLIAPFEYDLTT